MHLAAFTEIVQFQAAVLLSFANGTATSDLAANHLSGALPGQEVIRMSWLADLARLKIRR